MKSTRLAFYLLLVLASFSLMSYESSPTAVPVRAMYATVWSINSPEKVDHLLQTASEYGFNQIFFQSRYRGDALYIPNRSDSTYENNEKLCYVVKDSAFDPLGYAIEHAKQYNIEIHAWVTMMVMTPHDLWKLDSSHAYFRHPEWLTYDRSGKPMPNNVQEGAFFDAGVPAVQNYIMNVVSDLATNYDIAGIQFDYIRYPDSTYGYNPIALNEYSKETEGSFADWKREQLSTFVNKLYLQLKNIRPDMQVSAAVIAKRDKAYNKYSQDWPKWLKERYIDKVYLMAYNTSNKTFTQLISDVSKISPRKKMVIVVRAWPPGKPYPVSQINEKLKIARRHHFKNFGFYSYSGMVDNNYLPGIEF